MRASPSNRKMAAAPAPGLRAALESVLQAAGSLDQVLMRSCEIHQDSEVDLPSSFPGVDVCQDVTLTTKPRTPHPIPFALKLPNPTPCTLIPSAIKCLNPKSQTLIQVSAAPRDPNQSLGGLAGLRSPRVRASLPG